MRLAATIAAAAALGGCATGGGSTTERSATAFRCDRFAAPSGSDRAGGSAGAPYRTAQRLVDALRPGQTGCLRAGTYREDVRPRHGGAAGAPITLRSAVGARATIVGRLWIPHGSNWVTIADLALDGTYRDGTNRARLPSPTVDAAHTTFVDDEVTNDHTLICFVIGDERAGRATDTLIADSRVHDCGRLPPRNHDHGIYIADADRTVIRDDLVYDNADRGIQLYPDAQGTVIEGNVIAANGEGVIFSGDGGVASDGTLVDHNVIVDSRVRANVESFYPPHNPLGTRNWVRDNCLFGGARDYGGDGGLGAQVGFAAAGNIRHDPDFADPAHGDFQMPAGNPCRALVEAAG